MKIIIPIDQPYRLKLEAFIKTANAEFELEKAEEKTEAKIAANIEKLTAEVAKLEADFDGTDMVLLEKLTNKKNQAALMKAKIEEFEDEGKVITARRATWHRLMLEMYAAFREYYRPFSAELKMHVENTIRPLLNPARC